ncbi:MAG TPA: STAUR_1299 family protein [Syntrophobacteria bacterium]|nr:STAUR_1299 family protein [Syntrophobacteria bacterium]
MPKGVPRNADEKGFIVAEYLRMLRDKAFETVPGELYNQYRQDVSERGEQRFLFYEISLMEPRPWSHLRDLVYPNFVRYLRAKRRYPDHLSRVVVAIFVEKHCHLVRGEDFLAVYREMEGLDTAAFAEKVEQWLSQSAEARHYPVTTASPRR